VREVIREFSCDEEIVFKLNEANVKFRQHGAALEFVKEDDEEGTLTLLSTSNTNYKILYICAYLLSRQGYKVGLIKEGESIDDIIPQLKLAFREEHEEDEAAEEK